MKSYSKDIVSSEQLQQQLDNLKIREDKRYKITLTLIAALGASTSALAGVTIFILSKI